MLECGATTFVACSGVSSQQMTLIIRLCSCIMVLREAELVLSRRVNDLIPDEIWIGTDFWSEFYRILTCKEKWTTWDYEIFSCACGLPEIEGMPPHWLKLFSKYGAVIRDYFVDEPRSMREDRDVGNYLMSWLFRTVWPEVYKESEQLKWLNEEHLADVIEAFFGVVHWKKNLDQGIPCQVIIVNSKLSEALQCCFDLDRSGFACRGDFKEFINYYKKMCSEFDVVINR